MKIGVLQSKPSLSLKSKLSYPVDLSTDMYEMDLGLHILNPAPIFTRRNCEFYEGLDSSMQRHCYPASDFVVQDTCWGHRSWVSDLRCNSLGNSLNATTLDRPGVFLSS